MKHSSRRGGLAAVVLGSAIGVGSMSGCGAALLAGAGYLAAEEIAQSNVEAARIRANGGDSGEQERAEMREMLKEMFKTEFFVCSYADPSLDGEAATFKIKHDVIGRRTENPAIFREGAGVYFVGKIWSDELKEVGLRVYNERGEEIFSEADMMPSQSVASHHGYAPGTLSKGRYKAIWYLDDKVIGSVEAEVRDASSVLTQK